MDDGKSSDPVVTQPRDVELVNAEADATDAAQTTEDARERWHRETDVQNAAPPPPKNAGASSNAEALKEGWKKKWRVEDRSAPISGAPHSPLVAPEPSNYFASGDPQDFQCVARCGEFTYEEKRARRDRLLPCFVNGPCVSSEPCTVSGSSCCGRKGAQWRCCSRAGNFTVLLERLVPRDHPQAGGTKTGIGSQGFDDDDTADNSDGGSSADEESGARPRPLGPKRELWLVLGPYWPFCVSLTTNLAVVVPTALVLFFWNVLPVYVTGFLVGAMLVTLVALGSVACRDPGLVPHVSEEPLESFRADPKERPSKKWIFNDLTQSWRPRGAVFDRDVNAVVKGFDHVCPFTGTAIGENNTGSFYVFVTSITCLIYLSIGVAAYGFYIIAKTGYTAPHDKGD